MQAEAQGDMPTPSVPNRKQRGGRQGLTLLLIFLLLIGAVALLFRHQADSTTRHLPTTIHWQQVLQQYFVESLVAAPGDSATLYTCALPSPPELNLNALPSLTALSQDQLSSGVLLRSSDAGMHWQMLKASLGDTLDCSITVNPARASDLYVAGTSLASPDSAVLQHSSDGGHTWTIIQATLAASNGHRVAWAGSRLSFIGSRLFAIQRLQNIYHLISSTDGGRNWTAIDMKLLKPHQELRSYVVDPTAPNTIYGLAGAITRERVLYVPSGATPPPVPSPIPADQLVSRLYKSTDGGASWHELLSSVPADSSIQIASTSHNLIYVGGLTGSISTSSQGAFHMQSSSDGGATWQPIAAPANMPLLNNWFVDASGLLYDTTSHVGTPRSGNQFSPVGSIQRYDPSDNQWSTLAIPSAAGFLIAVTPAVSNGGDVLWSINLGTALYRGTL